MLKTKARIVQKNAEIDKPFYSRCQVFQGIQIKNGVVVAKDLKTNELTEFRRHPGIKLLVVADDVKSPKAGADKPTGTKKSGKASNFED